MARSTLERVCLLLVLVLTGLAAADVACAWPCLSADVSAGAVAQSGAPTHDCHTAVARPDGPVVSPSSDSCGMGHDSQGPVSERAVNRSAVPYDSAGTVGVVLAVQVGLDAGMGVAYRPPPTISDLPGHAPPLRI